MNTEWLSKVTPLLVLKWSAVIFVTVIEVLIAVILILGIVGAFD